MGIIIKPIVTEKMTAMGEKYNRYGFRVDPKADKLQIKKAVEEVSGTLFSSLCTVLRQPVCVTTTEYAGRTHPVCVSFAAGVPSVLGVRFS